MTLLFGVFSSVVSQWRSSDQRIDAFRDARAALLLITRDLSRAHVNGDPQMITLKDDTGTYAKEAYVITPIPNAGKSELCAVGYYCAWDGVAKAFTLKRLFKDSDATITSLQGPTVNFATLYTKVPANEEDLAACVWDLQFAPGVDADPEPPSSTPSTSWHWIEVRFKSMGPTAARKLRNLAVSESTWGTPSTDPTLYRNTILPYEQQFVSRVMIQQTQ